MKNKHSDNEKLIEMIRNNAEKTLRREVVSGIGAFAGAFDISGLKDMERPVLISSCDGIGTKIKVALAMNRFDTIGSDCVAICVNDILCLGAEPLFFLDHIACTRHKFDVIEQIIEGMAKGCEESGITLLGGETSELSDLYGKEEIGVVGFAVGVADKANMVDETSIRAGNSIIGIASSGLHANGYSAVRNAFRNFNEETLNTYFDSIGQTLGEALLEPAKNYLAPVKKIGQEGIRIRGLSHISSGSFKENISRILPDDVSAEISMSSFAHPPIFNMIEESGGFSPEYMYDTFNMGIGMTVIVAKEDRENALRAIRYAGETAFVIGNIVPGSKEVSFIE